MRKLNVSIVVGVIVAVIGAGIVVAYGETINHRASDGSHSVAVLVADTDLQAGEPASALRGHVRVVHMPSLYVVSGALTSLDAMTGVGADSMVLTGPIARGAQLSRTNFADTATAGRVQPAPGHVAISVETDLSPGVARYIAVGQLVDVFATYHDVRDQNGRLAVASSRTKLFASGIRVLAVSVAQTKDSNQSNSSYSGSSLDDKVVAVLDMTPVQAEKLVNAATLGEIYLADTGGSSDVTSTGVVPDNVVLTH